MVSASEQIADSYR